MQGGNCAGAMAAPLPAPAARATGVTPAPQFAKDWLSWGDGPRACQYLILGGKVRSILHGRSFVSTDDIKAVSKPVLRHRLVLNFAAESEGLTTDMIVERVLEHVQAAQAKTA
jgi:MoxR-like ATPase